MDEERKNNKSEKQHANVVYALADYKQLVIQYRTKHAELVKALAFWKTTAVWLAVITAVCSVTVLAMYRDQRGQMLGAMRSLNAMNTRLQFLSNRFESREQELTAARGELEAQSAQIRQLEKSLSTASKKQVEKLLKDSEPK